TVGNVEHTNFAGINRCYKLIDEPVHPHGVAGISSQDTLANGLWNEASGKLNPKGIFLSKVDLENDIAQELPLLICDYSDSGIDIHAAVKYLQAKKAVRMR
ncbi:ATP-dependent endonuclease, partial [Salmonella enterica subsp. enterica serovar 1,4,[5],12:i:-]|nr:ATP-dependent endonuclease [Salmonella enterica subsp. enterica serovar 1,4,[5],12:i:-]